MRTEFEDLVPDDIRHQYLREIREEVEALELIEMDERPGVTDYELSHYL